MIHFLSKSAALVALVFLEATKGQTPLYHVSMIDGLLGPSNPQGINNHGQVVGSQRGDPLGDRAFISDSNGKNARLLGPLSGEHTYAKAINDTGRVVGFQGYSGREIAFITDAGGTAPRPLGGFGGNSTYANAINNSSQVVGASTVTPHGGYMAFVTDPNAANLRALGNLGGVFSSAYDINEKGQVVGMTMDASGVKRAFVTDANGTNMREIGTFGGTYSTANAINARGQVVGMSADPSGRFLAFITNPNGENMQPLAMPGALNNWANDISEGGNVVGWFACQDGKTRAFVTDPNGDNIRDLNHALVNPLGLQGDILSSATAINSHGQIVAFGERNAYLLTPVAVPEPHEWAVVGGLALLGFGAWRRRCSGRRAILFRNMLARMHLICLHRTRKYDGNAEFDTADLLVHLR